MSRTLELSFVASNARQGTRIDRFLSSQLRNFTTWRIARLVGTGHVQIDHQPAALDSRVAAGQAISVRLVEPPDKLLEPEQEPIDFVYLDRWIGVINKRPGVIVHPTGPVDTGTLAHHLQAWLDTQTKVRSLARPGIAHRLDGETSGALAVAFEADAHRGLAESFELSQVSKSYLAIVEGVLKDDEFAIRQPIGRARAGSRVLMSCRGDAADRKPATTFVKTLQRFPTSGHSLVRCLPRTGRNHQIRVHLSAVGHPLLGDQYYRANGRYHTKGERVDTGLPIKRHALHAERVAFTHPIGGGWVDVTAPPPNDFLTTLALLAARE